MTLFGWPQWILLLFLFVAGSASGSFLSVCIHRFPNHERLRDQLLVLTSPTWSHFPRCGNRISFTDNIPILGWLRLAGRCRNCRSPISMRYPLLELLNGFLFAFVYWMEVPGHFGATLADSCIHASLGPHPTFESWWSSPAAIVNLRYVYHMVLIEALVVATFIDFEFKIIPDGSTIPAMAIGILGGLLYGRMFLVPVWFQDPSYLRTLDLLGPEWIPDLSGVPALPAWITAHPHLHGLAVSLVGMLVGGGMVLGVRTMGHWVLRQEAMGLGDVVLMGMVGSFLGWQPTAIVFFLAPLCALVVVAFCWVFRRDREIPYGPYLSLGTLLVILGWKQIWPRAERIFDLGLLLPIVGIAAAGMFVVSLHAVQFVKRMLGIPLYHEEWIEEWTSADQLTYQSGERVDNLAGQWRREEWPGVNAGRGLAHERRWRTGR